MSEYLKLKGKEATLKARRTSLVLAAGSHIKALKDHLATALIEPLADIEVDAIDFHSSQLKALRGKYDQISEDIGKIKKELGEG